MAVFTIICPIYHAFYGIFIWYKIFNFVLTQRPKVILSVEVRHAIRIFLILSHVASRFRYSRE